MLLSWVPCPNSPPGSSFRPGLHLFREECVGISGLPGHSLGLIRKSCERCRLNTPVSYNDRMLAKRMKPALDCLGLLTTDTSKKRSHSRHRPNVRNVRTRDSSRRHDPKPQPHPLSEERCAANSIPLRDPGP
jgi:hypothetical protein